MNLRPQNERILFGLKLRQLRQDRDLSFQQFSKLTGMSVSYLNEIEKGKKKPKEDKIEIIASTLGLTLDELTNLSFGAAQKPIANLLRSNFLNELPLDKFGIELSKVVEIISNAPARVGAFISTLLELSRKYAVVNESFYVGALRAWMEMHHNFLQDCEDLANKFRSKQGWSNSFVPTELELQTILESKFEYFIDKDGIDKYADFKDLDRVFITSSRTLLLNSSLKPSDLRYHYALEIGYRELKLEDRSLIYPLHEVLNFDTALAHARANAFASALLLPEDQVEFEISQIFNGEGAEVDSFEKFLNNYKVRPHVLLDRIAAILPRKKDISDLFLIQLQKQKNDKAKIVKELHLGGQHHPHSTGLVEHYCRRWMATRFLLAPTDRLQIGVQKIKFNKTDVEYLIIAIASNQHNGTRECSFIGIPLSQEIEKIIPSLIKSNLKQTIVNNTCERCSIFDCRERVAEPIVVKAKQDRKAIQLKIKDLQRNLRISVKRNADK